VSSKFLFLTKKLPRLGIEYFAKPVLEAAKER
jgi:hypothetical protein